MLRIQSRLPRLAYGAVALLVALICAQLQTSGPAIAQAGITPVGASANPIKRSGYSFGKETCGQAPLAFPNLRIGMRPGYCAGLVASKEDGLVFPRSIVQVPDTGLFVVADMGGWKSWHRTTAPA